MSAFTWPPSSLAGAEAGEGEHVESAVLIPVFAAGPREEPHVVLTRRRADLRRHAGEISFPGGRRDAADADLSVTALREAEEEIGLDRDRVRLIGELPATSTFATKYRIHPFLGVIEPGRAWRPSALEVDAVLELALSAIGAGRTRARLERRGNEFEIDAFRVDGHLIWGATARILEDVFVYFEREAPALTRWASSPRGPTTPR